MLDNRLLDKKVIIFDIGNVLLKFDPNHLANELFPSVSRDQLFEGVFKSGLWPLIDTGLVSTGRLATLMQEASHSTSPADYRAITNLLDYFYDYLIPLPALEWLPLLKKMGKKIYYLTNFSSPQFDRGFTKYDLFQYFDGGVVSSHENVSKPARRIFDILTDRYGFSPSDAIFIDDSSANIQTAKELGFNTWHYTDYIL